MNILTLTLCNNDAFQRFAGLSDLSVFLLCLELEFYYLFLKAGESELNYPTPVSV